MKRQKIALIIETVFLLVSIISIVLGFSSNTVNYNNNVTIFVPVGNNVSSEKYQNIFSLGQVLTGKVVSSEYNNSLGFWNTINISKFAVYLDTNVSYCIGMSVDDFVFVPTSVNSKNVKIRGQTDTICALNVTNTGIISGDLYMKVNETHPQGKITIGCNTGGNNYSQSTNLTDSFQVYNYSISSEESVHIWCWAWFDNPTETWNVEIVSEYN